MADKLDTKSETQPLQTVNTEPAAIVPAQPSAPAIHVVTWSQDRIDLLKRTLIPQGCPDDDFLLFIETCKRTGLDPLLKQAFCVETFVKVWDRRARQEINVTRYEFRASEAGMASRCDMQPDYRGIKAAAVYEGDEITIDSETGEVVHKWSPVKRAGKKLIGAWAHAFREGRFVPVTWLPLESRVQRKRDGAPTKFWATMPDTMLVKCARAEQYRLAYPNMFEGTYIREEMPEDEDERDVTPAAGAKEAEPEPARTRTEEVREKVQQRASRARASEQVVDAKPEPAKEEPKAEPKPATPADVHAFEPPVAKFGGPSVKGQRLGDLSTEELEGLVESGEKALADAGPNSRAKWVPTVKANLDQIRAEIAKREPPAPTNPDEWSSLEEPAGGRNEDEIPF